LLLHIFLRSPLIHPVREGIAVTGGDSCDDLTIQVQGYVGKKVQ
jgi:hypothetical protein